MQRRSAIALMITIFFIMAISISLGIALKQVKQARSEILKQNFLLQTNIILEDVLKILRDSKELEVIVKEESKEALYIFLSQAGFIPFEHSGIAVSIEIKSARSTLNINSIVDEEGKVIKPRYNSLINYLSLYRVNSNYVDMLLDNMNPVNQTEEDKYYNTGIFDDNPDLFREYIASSEHIEDINDYYMKYYNENNLENIDFEETFYFSKDINTSVDVNYATAETWRLLIGCNEVRAEELTLGSGTYAKVSDLELTSEEKTLLTYFKPSYYEPFLDVRVEIKEGDLDAKIRFEYDMKAKKGSNFIYEI